MEALKLFSKYAPNKTFLAMIFGSLSGLLYAFLIPVVMGSLTSDERFSVENKIVEIFGIEVVNVQFATTFLLLCLLILLTRSLSSVFLAHIALDIRFRLRRDLYKRVRKAPLVALEGVGESRLIQGLSTDVAAIVMGAQLFPQILTNVVTLIGMLGYLAYLDVDTFIYVVQIILFGVVTYQIPVYFGTRYFTLARDCKDRLQEAFKGLIGGAKELKLCVDKQQRFEQEALIDEETALLKLEKTGMTIYTLANNYGGLLCFFAIGGLAFIFINYNDLSNLQVIAAVMVLLYVTGPVGMLLGVVPQMARTRISINKINKLYGELPDEKISLQKHDVKPWQTMTLRSVVYHYPAAVGERVGFHIGPLDLCIKRGEVTFITGGNGSGKSTLAKVISQHVRPEKGEVLFDDVVVTEQNLTSYRNEVYCIYSDYYLFDRPLLKDENDVATLRLIEQYLKAFELDDKVQIVNGRFSTLRLSDGQRRRLALIVAILEDKALYLFDEWAADQDPQFKHVFYHDILPTLRARGKAVVVISHDDRYFEQVDKLLVMDSGQLIEQRLGTGLLDAPDNSKFKQVELQR